MALDLTPERGLLFRITHIANLPWLLTHGLHSANSAAKDPNFVEIGNPDLIAKRTGRQVPLAPHGTLADYVPFYFAPQSPMLLNIKTGYNGISRRPDDEIAILVSSCQAMRKSGVSLLFTDRHAYIATAAWTSETADLMTFIDWDILRRHDFARDDSYPDKMERYQAVALAHARVPPHALLCVASPTESAKRAIESDMRAAGLMLPVYVRPGWYFR